MPSILVRPPSRWDLENVIFDVFHLIKDEDESEAFGADYLIIFDHENLLGYVDIGHLSPNV